MKKAVILIAIMLAFLVFGWCGGNIWADHARDKEPIAFDIGTRLTYQVRGITVGGVVGLLIAGCNLTGSFRKRKQEITEHADSEGRP